MTDRRRFLKTTAGCLLSADLVTFLMADDERADRSGRKRIAFLGTWVRTHSHAQHFLDRLTQGYSWQGKWQRPRVNVASVFIDQFPDDDLARGRVEKHGLHLFPTVTDALTLGSDRLAVDGVVIIGEHGDYPKNEKGQTLYPRYKWFKEVVRVFENSGKAVPVFNDKHLSTSWDECVEMVEDSRRLGFPLLAGSSLPVTWRHPSVDMPLGADLTESVCTAYGGIDSYDIHALETAQCMSERRKGGEKGVSGVRAAKNEQVWNILDADDRGRTRDLFVAALNRSHNLPVETGYPSAPVTYEWARTALPNVTAYFVDHLDGFRTAIFLTGIRDFNYAGYRRDTDEIVSCQMYLPMPGHGSSTADFFNPLTRHIEDTMITGKAPYPVQRTLLTSGIVIAGVDSLHSDQAYVKTPHLNVAYRSPEESFFWRD